MTQVLQKLPLLSNKFEKIPFGVESCRWYHEPVQVDLGNEKVIEICAYESVAAVKTLPYVYMWGVLTDTISLPEPTKLFYRTIDEIFIEIMHTTFRTFRPKKEKLLKQNLIKELTREHFVDTRFQYW